MIPARKKFPGQLILLILAFIVLVWMIYLVFISKDTRLDEWTFEAINSFRNETLTKILRSITFLGNWNVLLPANLILLIYLAMKRTRWLALTAAIVSMSSLWIMVSLKSYTQRSRPVDPFIPGITNFSFPSGHAFMSVAFYGLLIWVDIKEIKDARIRQLTIAGLLLLIFTIGFSRIYLRVHYATDVIAGYCMGIIWLIACIWLMNKLQQRFKR